MEVSVQTFVTWKFFKSREMHQASRFSRISRSISESSSGCSALSPVTQWFASSSFKFSEEIHHSFGIQIVVTGPVIARWFRGRYWMGQLSYLRIFLP
jgi:hypothetical protein